MELREPETPPTDSTMFKPNWHYRANCISSYTTLARIHIEDNEEFVRDIILNRNKEEYPDPYLPNVYSSSILSRYRERIKEVTDNYEPKSEVEEEEIEMFKEREFERINNQLGYIHFPTPDEFGFSTESHKRIMRGADSKNPKILKWLYRMPLSDLRYLAAWFKVNHWKTEEKVFNSIRYVRGDSTVDFFNTLDVEDYDKKETDNIYAENSEGDTISVISGPNIDVIVDEIDNIINKYSNFPVAVGMAKMDNLSNMTTKETTGGRATLNGRVNIQSLSVTWDEGGESWNTIAHEFFHQIQFGLSIYDTRTKDDAEWKITADSADVETDVSEYGFIPKIMDKMIDVWQDFCDNPVHYLEDYQKKNMNEFYAVAFELYYEEPRKLRKSQPKVYDILHNLMN